MPRMKSVMALPNVTMTASVDSVSRFDIRLCSQRATIRMPRNESMMPDAARSWRNSFELTGMAPAPPRLTPTDAIRMTSAAR